MRSFLLAMRAFAAAMFGVRRRSQAESENQKFGIGHAVAAGVVMVAIFATVIFSIVNLIISSQS